MCRGLLSLTDSEEYACIQAGSESSECKQLEGSTGSEEWKTAAADNTAGKEQWKQTATDNRGLHSKAHARPAATKAERYVCVCVCACTCMCVYACNVLAETLLVLHMSPWVQLLHQTWYGDMWVHQLS